MNAEFFAAVEDIEKEKGIPRGYMFEKIQQAMLAAFRKDNPEYGENVEVILDEGKKRIELVINKTVVDEVEDPTAELDLDSAHTLSKKAKVGDVISIPVETKKFGRIAAQAAKQVIIQGIREAERGAVYDNYSSKAQEILTGTVLRMDPSGDMYIRIGTGTERSDAILRAGEQIPGEAYQEGDLIRVYVVDVHRSNRGPQVFVSRTHPNLVRRLFELEVPEIAEGLVEVRNIAREPGSRTKIAVRAAQEDIDPVGACVGPRGGRVGAIVNELHGEKMDIITWSEDPCQYVAAALSPAEVLSVDQIPGQKACRVVVPDDQLSLAIGKEGQNARLAARLTSYKIDIKPASKASEFPEKTPEPLPEAPLAQEPQTEEEE